MKRLAPYAIGDEIRCTLEYIITITTKKKGEVELFASFGDLRQRKLPRHARASESVSNSLTGWKLREGHLSGGLQAKRKEGGAFWGLGMVMKRVLPDFPLHIRQRDVSGRHITRRMSSSWAPPPPPP